MRNLTRNELVEKLEEIEFWPELEPHLDCYLDHYIHAKDVEIIRMLVNAGANPNPKSGADCYLRGLLHEYHATRSLKGALVIEIMELLLEFGADPNRVWGCNLRAYDLCDVPVITQLLERYGADPAAREPI